MDNVTLNNIIAIFAPLLTAIVAGFSVVVSVLMGKWVATEKTKAIMVEASEKIKIMQIIGKTSTEAVEQMYKDMPKEEKKRLGLQIAKNLYAEIGISVSDSEQLPANEAGVFSLKSLKIKTQIEPPAIPAIVIPPAVPETKIVTPPEIIPLG